MNLFFDTSALIKFFHEEPGTTTVTELVSNPENVIHLSDLVRLEFISALCRRYRNKEIDGQALNNAISGFNEEYSRFQIEPLGNTILQESEALLLKHAKTNGLRALDALHLATFILIKEDDWIFVASDDNLITLAKAIGASTINPLTYIL